MEPFELIRSDKKAPQLGPWAPDRNYTRLIVRPTNAEMTAIFNADQADRRAANIDWSKA
ncbi:hypothetical protein JQK15_20295 [Sphingobium sp. BHU LFT2]|uniref:hypothetical protein n=1 Tax=Sphingobium sp. BHU LFT2 TaxID=2807634 RepID=UPI001BE79E28|nr:hypothetical protein [Sphingobium sp. BHU LFT2]MBT2245856.1 hypothetical protein [Sphingobium sp. BHU LFT2]